MSLRSSRYAPLAGRVLRCLAAAGLVLGTGVVAGAITPGSAQAAPAPTAPSPGTIHPGVMLDNEQGQCTANFIFTTGDKLLIGQAAHCTGTGSESETNGCTSKSAPLGTKIKIEGASQPGTLVYNSWIAMRDNGEKDTNLCDFNDFALVEVDDADEDRVDPTVPKFGGPTGLHRGAVGAGANVYSYQNSGLRAGLSPASPKQGINLADSGGGWSHEVATITPGVPGDSGSGFMDASGKAFGLLSTLNLQPAPGTNGVTDLAKALDYANEHGDLGDVQLVNGERAFSAGILPGL